MSSKHNKAMQQLVELVATERELAGQKASIDAQLKIARLALASHENSIAGMFAPGEEIPVRSAHNKAMVTVKLSKRTEIIATDIDLVPVEFTKRELNKGVIRKMLPEDEIKRVPGLTLRVNEEVVFDVNLI
jgi:hypothetical protein